MASQNEGGPLNTTSETEVPNHRWGHGVKRGPSGRQTIAFWLLLRRKTWDSQGFMTPTDLEECEDRHRFGWRTRENFLRLLQPELYGFKE